MKYTVVLSPEPESGWYSVSCPALPGAISQGSSRDEALANIREAIECWLEAASETGMAPLEESREVILQEVERVLHDRFEEGWDASVELTTIDMSAVAAA
jgi:predicted RNase H-like HicB family nuclease